MALTRAEIDGLAVMTRLALGHEEAERMRGQLEAILGYVHRLAEIDTSDVPETELVQIGFTGCEDVPGSDEAYASERALILQNFPDSLGGALRVPAVFEKPKC